MISLFNLAPIEMRLKRIEQKLDLLMERAGIELDPIPGVSKEALAEIMDLVHSNKKIPAIKAYREATGEGLAESKAFIDSLYR